MVAALGWFVLGALVEAIRDRDWSRVIGIDVGLALLAALTAVRSLS